MKARIKATGEIINVRSYSAVNNEVESEHCDSYGNFKTYDTSDILLILDKQEPERIDWDEKLIELSGMAMQGIISSKRYYTVDTKYCISTYTYMENSRVASLSVGIAKELIKQLKEELK